MTDRVQTHEAAVYITSGGGPGMMWATVTDGTDTASAEVPYDAEVCDRFPTVAHNLRHRAIYQAIRAYLGDADPPPHPWG